MIIYDSLVTEAYRLSQIFSRKGISSARYTLWSGERGKRAIKPDIYDIFSQAERDNSELEQELSMLQDEMDDGGPGGNMVCLSFFSLFAYNPVFFPGGYI